MKQETITYGEAGVVFLGHHDLLLIHYSLLNQNKSA